MRKNLKALAQAAQAQQNTSPSALFMQAAPANQPAEAPAPEAAEQEATAPAEEAPEASPLTINRDEAPAEKPLFVPLLDTTPAPVVVPTPAPAAVVVPAPAPAPVIVPAPRSLDDLLNLVNQAKSVTDRLKAYRATGEKLSSFVLSREGFTDRLTIKDGSGLEWSTTKSSIIQKVVELLRTDLSTAIETAEVELRHMLPAA